MTFSDEDDTGVTVSAFTNEMAMEQFVMNFAPDVTVLEPERLREKVKNALKKALEKLRASEFAVVESVIRVEE